MGAVPVQRCKGCNAEIYWIKSMNGRAMPVDTKKASLVTAEGHVVSGFTSHFSTCPKAADFKKRPAKPAEQENLPNMDDTGPPPMRTPAERKAARKAELASAAPTRPLGGAAAIDQSLIDRARKAAASPSSGIPGVDE